MAKSIAEIMAEQSRKMKAATRKPAPEPKKATIKDIIANQSRRVQAYASVAATKKPAPDYVYKEPKPVPPPPTREERIRAFAEDRVYDDIKPKEGQEKFDPSRVNTAEDVHRILSKEQPEEYFRGTPMEVNKMMSFRSLDQGMVELGDKPAEPEYTRDTAMSAYDSPEAAAPVSEKVSKVVLNVPSSADMDAGAADTMGMTGVQRQMLAAMRSQRSRL